MNILSALKSEASRLHQQLDTINAAMKVLAGKNGVSRCKGARVPRNVACLQAREPEYRHYS